MRAYLLTLATAFGIAAVGCANEPRVPEQPVYARVTIVNATVAPAKVDGTAWDGLGGVIPTLAAGAARELGASTSASVVVAHVTGEALTSLSRPDPFGWAELRIAGPAQATTRVALRRGSSSTDTLTPAWPGTQSFAHVPLLETSRIRIHLEDHDLDDDDPMGDVELGVTELHAALASGHVYQVRVDDQTQGQILFVGVSVVPE